MNVIKSSEKQLNSRLFNDFTELTEEDFYPPADKRCIKSGIHNIRGSDNFYDYIELFDKYCAEYNDF